MPSTIRVSTGEGVTVVTVADPARRNALSRQLSDELDTAVRAAVADGARAGPGRRAARVLCRRLAR